MFSERDKFDFYCEEVLTGHTPVEKIYESENVLAFYHTKPSYERHIVIVPKQHIKDLTSIGEEDQDLILEIIFVASRLAANMDMSKGIRFMTNMGTLQDTPHLHFHLVQGEK